MRAAEKRENRVLKPFYINAKKVKKLGNAGIPEGYAWDHTQFQQPNGDAGARANFGRISASRPPRLIQLAVKAVWCFSAD